TRLSQFCHETTNCQLVFLLDPNIRLNSQHLFDLTPLVLIKNQFAQQLVLKQGLRSSSLEFKKAIPDRPQSIHAFEKTQFNHPVVSYLLIVSITSNVMIVV